MSEKPPAVSPCDSDPTSADNYRRMLLRQLADEWFNDWSRQQECQVDADLFFTDTSATLVDTDE